MHLKKYRRMSWHIEESSQIKTLPVSIPNIWVYNHVPWHAMILFMDAKHTIIIYENMMQWVLLNVNIFFSLFNSSFFNWYTVHIISHLIFWRSWHHQNSTCQKIQNLTGKQNLTKQHVYISLASFCSSLKVLWNATCPRPHQL